MSLRFSILAASAVVAFAATCVPVHADDNGLAGAIHTLRRERGRLCQVDHFHNGSSAGMPTKKAAVAAAIDSWQSFTAFEYGTDWARFRRAANKSVNCTQGGSGWSCSVDARPCR